MTRQKPISNKVCRIPLPPPIQKNHTSIQLFIDFFYVNKLPFLHTKSSKINFLSIQSGKTRSTASIKAGLDTVIDIYNARGFDITDIHGDNEFNIASLKQHLLPTATHIYGANEHVGVIERSIRTVKERCRSMCHTVPYKKYTKLMTIALVESAIYWLNSFPSDNGVSDTLSPANIVLGRPNIDFNHNKIVFGSYALVYAGTKNNMKSRSIPAIALNPSNEWGGHNFMSLYTGKRFTAMHGRSYPLTMTS
jgi:hypothetical protein